MKPRMKFVAALTALALGSAFGPAAAQTKIELTSADQFPLTHVGSKLGAQAFAAKLEAKSNGRVTVKHFPAQQVAKAAGMLDAVRNRLVDIAMVGVVYVTDRMPLTSAVELPGLFTDLEIGRAAFDKLAKNELNEAEYKPHKLVPLWVALTPPYQLMLRNKTTVKDLSDLKGLKIRIAGATGELTAKALGMVPVKVGPSDLYLSIERGTVDGAIYNPPSMFAYKIEEVIDSVTTNASLGTVAFVTFMHADRWNSLPPDVQQMITEVSEEVGSAFAAAFKKADRDAYTKLQNMGRTVVTLDDKVLGQMNEKLGEVEGVWLAQMKERNVPGAQILEAYRRYLAQ